MIVSIPQAIQAILFIKAIIRDMVSPVYWTSFSFSIGCCSIEYFVAHTSMLHRCIHLSRYDILDIFFLFLDIAPSVLRVVQFGHVRYVMETSSFWLVIVDFWALWNYEANML